MRLGAVHAEGPYAESAEALMRDAASGTRWSVLPADSIFFMSRAAIRAALLDAHPDVAAVSISRSGLRGLSVTLLPRVAAFLWCGESKPLDADSRCYAADAEGLAFAFVPTVPDEMQADAAAADVARSLPPAAQGLWIYGPLENGATENPIGARVRGAERIPETLRFAHALQAIGAPVQAIQFQDDEARLYLESGTYVRYVVGRENQALAIAQAAFPRIPLRDGSIEYVDLRFDGKAYVMPRDAR